MLLALRAPVQNVVGVVKEAELRLKYVVSCFKTKGRAMADPAVKLRSQVLLEFFR